jgi:hypothetical protein
LVTRFSIAVTKALIRFDPQPAQFPLYYFFFNSCCSHLEIRASVKRFVSLQFLNLLQSGDQPVARPLPNTNTE